MTQPSTYFDASPGKGRWVGQATDWLPIVIGVLLAIALVSKWADAALAVLAALVGSALVLWPRQGVFLLIGIVLLTTGKPESPGEMTLFSGTFRGLPLTPVEVCCLMLFFGAAAQRLLSANWKFRTAGFVPWLGLFLLLIVLSYLRTVLELGDPGRLYEMRRYGMLLTGFILSLFLLSDKDSVTKFVWVVVVAVGFRGILGVVRFAILLHNGGVENLWALYGGWGDTFVFVMYIVLLLSFLACGRKNTPELKVLILFLVPVLFVFLLSLRRTFFIGLIGALVTLLVLLPGRRKSIVGYAILVLSVSAASLLLAGVLDRLTGRLAYLFNPLEDASLSYRIIEFANVWENIKRHFWFGMPMGVPWEQHYRLPLPVLNPIGSHSTYLNILLRTGFVGLSVFLIMIWKLIRELSAVYRHASDESVRTIALWILLILVSFLMSAVTAPLFENKLSFILGIVLGMTIYVVEGASTSMAVRRE